MKTTTNCSSRFRPYSQPFTSITTNISMPDWRHFISFTLISMIMSNLVIVVQSRDALQAISENPDLSMVSNEYEFFFFCIPWSLIKHPFFCPNQYFTFLFLVYGKKKLQNLFLGVVVCLCVSVSVCVLSDSWPRRLEMDDWMNDWIVLDCIGYISLINIV